MTHICVFFLLLLIIGTLISITEAKVDETISNVDEKHDGDVRLTEAEAKKRAADSGAKRKEELKHKKKTKKKKSKDWGKINFNELEKVWEDGDEEEELEMEYERNKKIAERKMKEREMEFNPNDPESIQKFVDAQQKGVSTNANPVMMFITLPDMYEGKKWTAESRKFLCQKWSTLLRAGSLDAELYDIGETSLLINIKKGWLVQDALKFILQQPEAVKVTKDNKDFYLKDVIDDDEL